MLGLGLSLAKQAVKVFSYVKDTLKAYYRFYDTQPDFLLDGSTSFDGTDDYIDTGVAFSNTVHTISGWFKLDNVSGNRTLFCGRDGNDDGIRVLLNTSQIAYQINTDDELSGTSSISANVWTHVACTYDGTTQSIYLNGSLSASQSISRTVSTTQTAKIGRTAYGTSDYMLGMLANIGLWDRALSASEIESIYWRGSHSELQNTELTNLVSWYDLDSETLGNNLITNGDFPSGLSDGEHGYDNGDGTVDGWTGIINDVLSLDSSTKDGSANSLKIVNSSGWLTTSYNLGTLTDGKVYRVSYDISVVSGGANRRVGISNNTNSGSSEYLSGASATPTDGGGWESGSFTFQKSTTETSYFKVMGFTATIYLDNIVVQELSLEDSQGSNNGAPIGVTTNSDSYSGESPFKPRIQDKAHPKMAVQLADGSTSFDGVDDYISIPDSSNLSFGDGSSDSAFSISAWVKMNDATDANRITKGVDGDNTHEWFFGNSGDKLYFYAWDESASAYVGRLYNTDITSYENQWIHICGTYSGNEASSGFKIYIDGSRVDDTNFQNGTYTAIENLGADIHIGRYVTGYHDGLMANVAIHSSELTQTQIQELMFTEKYSGLSADLKTNLVSWYDLGSTTLGSELITNGDFSDGSTGWTLGSFSIVNGQATITDASATDYSLDSDTITGFDTSKRYQLSYDCIANTAGIQSGVYIRNADLSPTGIFLKHTDTGTKTLIFTPTATSHRIRLYHDGGGAGDTTTFDNVSVKEITLDDSEGTNHGSPVGTTTNTGYTYSPHGVVDPLNFGEVYSGRALDFDGINDSVNVGVVSDYSSSSGSISVWIYSHNNATPSLQGIITNGSTGSDSHYVGISSNKVRYTTRNADSLHTIFADSDVPENQWTHVVATRSYDGANTTTKLYINGVLQADSATYAGVQESNSNDILIGFLNTTRYFDGLINNVKIFNSSLTQDQVRELYTKPETVLPTGVSASNLKLDLPIQEGSGSYIYDGSGNQNHGTISGATWVSGQEYGYQASLVRSNTPMIFDGTDDDITVTDSSSIQNIFDSGGTISAWVYINSDGEGNAGRIMDKRVANVNGWILYTVLESSGNVNIRFFHEFSSVSGRWDITAPINQWNHLAITYDSGNVSNDPVMYLNGSSETVSEVVTPVGTRLTDVGQNLFIGNKSDGNSTFDGIINEVAIWEVALDADAVTQLYGSGTPLLPTSDSGNYDNSDSLVGYWRNDSNTTWTDRANTGVASFDGSSFINCGNITEINAVSKISMCAWVKPDVLGSDDGIMSKGNSGSNRTFMSIRNSNGGVISGISNGSSAYGFTPDSALSVGTWAFVATIFDGTQSTNADRLKIYVNGVLQSLTFSGTIASTTANISNNFNIGIELETGVRMFFGQMASASLFDVALTSDEVSELYNIDKRSSISGHSQFSNCVGSWLMGAGTGDTTSIIQDQSTANNDGTISGVDLIGYNDGTASGSPVEIVIPEGSTEGRDNQGYYLSDTTTISNGARFFGDKEYIKVQDSEILQDIFDGGGSIEAWFYAESDGGSNGGRIINKRASGNGYLLYTISESGSNVTIQFAHEFSTTDGKWTITVPMKQWHHIVLTYDNGSVANNPVIYLNGISQTVTEAQTPVGTSLTDVGQDLYIGNDVNGVVNFDGKIDEVRIYKKVLSADEVSRNYNNGKSSHQ